MCLFAAAVVGFFYFEPFGSPTPNTGAPVPDAPQIFASNQAQRDVPPSNALPAPVIEETRLERLPAVEPPPQPKKPAKRVSWSRPVATAPGFLKINEIMIELADIDPISLDRVCTDLNGTSWPCGMLARTEMRLLLRGRAVDCDSVGEQQNDAVKTRCSVGGIDISSWLVLTGWATPHGDQFAKEYAEAKDQERGQWRKTAP